MNHLEATAKRINRNFSMEVEKGLEFDKKASSKKAMRVLESLPLAGYEIKYVSFSDDDATPKYLKVSNKEEFIEDLKLLIEFGNLENYMTTTCNGFRKHYLRFGFKESNSSQAWIITEKGAISYEKDRSFKIGA
ncbi:hypothetical protein [Halonatronum saccharophilum]|uniref:hypothetical protein n=1 Tax=Halonatronum saccharophilum TaxID=150060 RepID=UPI000483E716|nr:hypothetical protein [Halonatronum saccharophilum]